MAIEIACAVCGTLYREKPYRANDPNRRNYCSRGCYAKGRTLFVARPTEERFWEQVAKAEGDACWLWTGQLMWKGYGTMYVGGRAGGMKRAHRVSWELANGPIPNGLDVLHSCDVRNCVKPGHLFLGTNAENHADKMAKGRESRGERTKQSKLTEPQVVEIRRRFAAGGCEQKSLAQDYGVCGSVISAIVNRRSWKHVPQDV